ncbi:hypothetical protein [Streptomyces sp. NRRL F-5123]|uniref:hypothetical protein n=1 Tax=Streptomyces sp. NRRL F-5123 TaxID=1463856 RepID=UPI0004E26509|nr:hypothetical protein [Streptomyces sp. NRRL F-5123]
MPALIRRRRVLLAVSAAATAAVMLVPGYAYAGIGDAGTSGSSDPGTSYAQTYPASGKCKGTGKAWTAGAGNVPPCGVVFLKDSGKGRTR